MTVAPRYAEYEDASDTGISVPLELPRACSSAEQHAGTCTAGEASAGVLSVDGEETAPNSEAAAEAAQGAAHSHAGQQAAAALATRRARYFLCRRAHLDLRYSILCQAALAAPLMLWSARGAPSPAAGHLDSPASSAAEGESKSAAAGSAHAQPEHGSGQQSMPMPSVSHASAEAAAGGLVFVGNDWPCAPLALRLKHCVRGVQASDPRQPVPAEVQSNALAAAGQGEAAHAAGLGAPESPAALPEQLDADHAAAADAAEAPAAEDEREFWARLADSLQGARMAFTVHNLAYQGACSLETFPRLCLPDSALPALQWPPPPEQATASDVLALENATQGAALLCCTEILQAVA